MNLIEKRMIKNEKILYFDSIEISDIENIIKQIETNGYAFIRIDLTFVHDDSLWITPREYNNSLDLIVDLSSSEYEYDMKWISRVLFEAEKGCRKLQGAIHFQYNIISYTDIEM